MRPRIIRRKMIDWYRAAEQGKRGAWLARLLRFKITVHAPHVLRLLGFTVGAPTEGLYVARRECGIEVMRLPTGARTLATGQPVQSVSLSPLGWARILMWRVSGRV